MLYLWVDFDSEWKLMESVGEVIIHVWKMLCVRLQWNVVLPAVKVDQWTLTILLYRVNGWNNVWNCFHQQTFLKVQFC